MSSTNRRGLLVAMIVAAAYVLPVASVGLMTDVGGHLIFAEKVAITGRAFGPFYLFEQTVILVRTMVPFHALGALIPALTTRQSTWDVAGVLTVVGFAGAGAFVVHRHLSAAAGSTRTAWRLAVVATIGLYLAAPITLLTWSRRQLLVGYANVTTYEGATTNALKPFALVLFWYLSLRLARRGARATRREIVTLAAIAAVTLHAKPTFTVCLLPATLLLLVLARVTGRRLDERLALLGFVVPSAVVLLWQATSFPQGGRIGFDPLQVARDSLALKGWPVAMAIPLLIASMALPLSAAALRPDLVRHGLGLVLAWISTAAAVAAYYLFRVTGRVDYGELLGSLQITMFVLFAETVRVLLADLRRRNPGRGPWRFGRRDRVLGAIFALHVACGGLLWWFEVTAPTRWW